MESSLKKAVRLTWNALRTGVVVAIITLMIWVVADRNVTESDHFNINVRLQSSNPERYIAFADPPFQKTLSLSASGLRSRLRDFQSIAQEQTVFVVDLENSKPPSLEPQQISTIDDVLRRIKEVRDSRLSISSVDPDNFMVRVDQYETIEHVRVKPDYGQLKVTAELSFDEVSIKLPRFIARQLQANPVARASAEAQLRAAAGPDGTFQVRVPLVLDAVKELDPNGKLEMSPDNQVTIRGRIEALTEVQSKGPVQVTWSVPDIVQKQYVIVAQDPNLRVYIDVQGPKSRLDQLDPADIRGLVEVFAGDTDDPGPDHEITRKVQFFLPPEFTDCALAPQSQQFEVKFRLKERVPLKTAEPASASNP